VSVSGMAVSVAVVLLAAGVGLASAQEFSPNVPVFAVGLNEPRGLTFGPDGALYVAEGGRGGTDTTTEKECPQVPTAGPYSGGFTRGSRGSTRTALARQWPTTCRRARRTRVSARS
jgi:hypothetical protein